MSTYYAIGSNMPGYLPEEDEASVFAFLDDARSALAEIMREDADRCAEYASATDHADVIADLESIAAELEGVAGILTSATHELDPGGAFSDISRDPSGNDRCYWIEPLPMGEILALGTVDPRTAVDLALEGLEASDPGVARLIDPSMADPVALAGLIARLTDLRDAVAAGMEAETDA